MVPGAISGAGTLTHAGTGTTILTGANTYTGTTTVSAGTLQVGNGGTTGQLGSGAIINNGSLVFNRSDAIAVSNPISGIGSLTQAGHGSLTLFGVKTYTGNTFVQEGTLVLDGSLAGSVSVASPARLGGAGFIGGTLTVNGAVMVGSVDTESRLNNASQTFGSRRRTGLSQSHRALAASAGASLGTLSIAGNVTLTSGARAIVTLDAAGGHTLLETSGAAAIGGATIVVAPRPGSYDRVTIYPVLYAAGGLTGSATTATTNTTLWPWANSTQDALLVTLLNAAVPFQPFATTTNGAAIGAVFDRLRPSATGDFLSVSRELTALDDAGLASALDDLAGEIHPSSVQLAALDGEAATDMVREELASRGTFETGLSASERWTWRGGHLWTRVQTGRTLFDASVTHGGESSLFGLAGGMDWSLGDRWVAGVGGGYAAGSLTLDGISESSDYAAPRGFGYVGYTRARWAASGGMSLARAAYSTERAFQFIARLPDTFGGGPIFGGVSRNATSEASGLATDLWGDWAVPVGVAGWMVRPVASFRFAHYSRHAWNETGADSLSLSAPAQAIQSVQAGVGLQVVRSAGRFRPIVSTMYRRELTDGRTATTLHLLDDSSGQFLADGLFLAKNTFSIRPGFAFRTDQFEMSVAIDLRRASMQNRRALEFGLGF
jgi:autotransporter-associated beta strand protein